MHNASNTVTEADGRIISRANVLKRQLMARHNEIGVWFARELSREWRERDMGGLAVACWCVQQELANVAGAYDLFAEARALAGAVAR